ncbi:hypothetical protein XA68_17367 [Ophiocordyceps unilateralis]|uniref:Uncharacterized protein n=1 Tax=Ophiocordyceps unilateralis TaxID=268505 RepID=A0A2A9P4P1_OPHUN|nr:hypothetical protein XA68_17367 [Ophiocordyceps unilateralis]
MDDAVDGSHRLASTSQQDRASPPQQVASRLGRLHRHHDAQQQPIESLVGELSMQTDQNTLMDDVGDAHPEGLLLDLMRMRRKLSRRHSVRSARPKDALAKPVRYPPSSALMSLRNLKLAGDDVPPSLGHTSVALTGFGHSEQSKARSSADLRLPESKAPPTSIDIIQCPDPAVEPTMPKIEADEGYCDNELASNGLVLPAMAYRSIGSSRLLAYRTSTEAALQCSTVVQKRPRMRRRRHKEANQSRNPPQS